MCLQADNVRRLSGLERMAEAHTRAAIAAALAGLALMFSDKYHACASMMPAALGQLKDKHCSCIDAWLHPWICAAC